MITFFGIVAALGSVAGALILVLGMAAAKGAPQEAAIAAMAVAVAVIPYVIFRAVQVIKQAYLTRDFQKELLRRLDALEK